MIKKCQAITASFFVLTSLIFNVAIARAQTTQPRFFDRIIIVVLENTSYARAIQQPFLKQLANQGALFTSYHAVTHPSQGNYVALTSGGLQGVKNDSTVDLNVANIADRLEQSGLTWKVYAEGFPGQCFTGARKGDYVRKHNPMVSYVSIQNSPQRCAKIVASQQFDVDAASGQLPNYSLYIPDLKSDGHDTGVAFADRWMKNTFSKYLSQKPFLQNTVFVTTFDENDGSPSNGVYTSIVGSQVKAGVYNNVLTHYSLLKLVEENWNLAPLTSEDQNANSFPSIWK